VCRIILEIDQYIGLANLDFIDISVSASGGVDKMLLYSSHMQTTCARKHNKPSQDSYLAATPAGAFSKSSRQDELWGTRRLLQLK